MNILLIHNKVIQKFLPFTRSEDLVDLINLGLLMVLQQFLLVQTLKQPPKVSEKPNPFVSFGFFLILYLLVCVLYT